MPDLATFQGSFGSALAGLSPVRDPRVSRAITIHRNTATKAAVDALADNYPVVAALVGEDAFTGLAYEYVDAAPPVDPRLCLYGVGFDRHLAAHTALAELPYLTEVASLERMVVEALFAADRDPLDAGSVSGELDLGEVLGIHPAARWATFDSPAAGIWSAHQPDAVPHALDRLEWTAESALVTRPDEAVIVTVLPDGAAAFLDACRDGRPLGEAAATVDGDLAGIFAALIGAGAFA